MKKIVLLLVISIGFTFSALSQITVNKKKFMVSVANYIKDHEHTRIYNFKTSSVRKWKSDIAIITRKGEINLFTHIDVMTMNSNSIITDYILNSNSSGQIYSDDFDSYAPGVTYVIQKKGTKDYFGIYNIAQFKKYFLPLIADNEELTEEVLSANKNKWIEFLPLITEKYNNNLIAE